MEPSQPQLAGRYRYLGPFETGDVLARWFAVDGESGQPVLAAVVSQEALAHLRPILGEKHLHLAGVLDVIEAPEPAAVPGGQVPVGGAVVLTEAVAGQLMSAQLAKGRIHPFKAVAWLLRLVDVLGIVHGKGGVHGAISPRSVVVEPVGRAIAPVLALHVAPPLAAFCSPERLAGAGPSVADDLWALHACLYAALTGVAPFEGTGADLLAKMKGRKYKALGDFGIDEPILQRVIERGFHPEERHRTTELEVLSDALDAWERGREPAAPRPKPPRFVRSIVGQVAESLVYETAELPATDVLEVPDVAVLAAASAPTAAPAAGAAVAVAPAVPVVPLPVVAIAPQPPTPRSRSLYVGLGLLLVAAIAGTVGLVVVLGKRPPEPSPVVQASSSVATTSSAPAAPRELTPTEQRAQCVNSFFEGEVLVGAASLDFVCSDEDFRQVSARLFSLASPQRPATGGSVDAGADLSERGIVVTGSVNPFDLGWYELAATAIVRTTCCSKATPITLPTTTGWCQQLQGQVRQLAEASRKPVDLSPYGRKFFDAVQCLYSTGTKRPYDYEDAPSPDQQQHFQRFLKHAAESDAKRSRMKWLR